MVRNIWEHAHKAYEKELNMGNICKMLFTFLLGPIGFLLLDASSVLATSGYLDQFNSRYGTSTTALNTCSVCHAAIPNLNAYGNDFVAGSDFVSIEGLDSDGDGFNNLDEINARTSPGDAASVPSTQPICTDNDGDGYAVEGEVCGPSDCNDLDVRIKPFAVEVCGDFIDNDCNGLTLDGQDDPRRLEPGFEQVTNHG